MLIRSVTLENVKSYESATMDFRPGTNAICGSNGAGKTTIIESIGYALFDHTPYRPITNMIKHGSKNGIISIVIEAKDGREYTVVRGIKGSKYFIHDNVMGMKLAEGKVDCLDWLAKYCGLEGESGESGSPGLSTLFTDVVAVPQGAMTAAFLQRPEQRKATFAPLLKVAGYRKAADCGNEWRRHVEAENHKTEKEISKLAGRTENYGEKKKESETLIGEIAGLDEAREKSSGRLAAMEKNRKALEDKEKELAELKKRKAVLDTGIRRMEKESAGKLEELERAKHAGIEAGRLRPDYERSLKMEKMTVELNKQSKERDGLNRTQSGFEAKLKSTDTALKDIRERLSMITGLRRQAEELRPDVEKQLELTERLSAIKGKINERKLLEQRFDQLEAQAGKLEEELNDIFRRSAGMEELEKRVTLRARYEKIVEKLVKKKATVQAEEKAISKNMKAAGDGNCPFLGEPCPSSKVGEKGLLSFFEGQIGERKRNIATITKNLKVQRRELHEAAKAAERLSLLEQELESKFL